MRGIAAGWNIGDCNQRTKSIVIERVGGKEVLVLVVTSSGPEVPDFLRADLRVYRVRRALQWRSRNLKNGQGWSIVRQWLSDTLI
jgi:hypothetical protein